MSIVRPLLGIAPFDRVNHQSLFQQDYPGDLEIVFCAEDEAEPSLEIVRALRAQFPRVAARIVVSRDVDAVGMMRNIVAGAEATRSEVIVFSDSDVRLAPGFLRHAASVVADTRVGLAFCPPLVEGNEDWVGTMFASAVNDSAVVVTALAGLGLYKEAIGATMVMRRTVLEEIGGLRQFRDRITHDVPLARAVCDSGFRVRVLHEVARIRHTRDPVGRAYAHLRRWLVIIRGYHPVAAVVAAPLDLPVYWALAYLFVARGSGPSILVGAAMLLAALLARPLSSALFERQLAAAGAPQRFFWGRCLLEWLRLPLHAQASFTTEVNWRGRRFRIASGGRAKVMA